jgi:hypothetical protein
MPFRWLKARFEEATIGPLEDISEGQLIVAKATGPIRGLDSAASSPLRHSRCDARVRLQAGVLDLPGANADALRRELEGSDWRVFILPRGITDRASFFDAVRETFPLDPSLVGDRVWDALSDSLWSGLDSLDDARISIIWPDSATMARKAPDEFEVAREILARITASLADPVATVGRSKQVAVVIT